MRLDDIIPALKWLRNYKKSEFSGDLPAGLLVAVMLIPQSMAYAMLAGLPPVIGLYASTLPLFVYALFGSSRHLAVGPVAIVSLLVYVGCSQLATPGSSEYIWIVLFLTFLVGIVQLLLGLCKAGFITNYISHAVVSGFTSAGAVIICLSQAKHLLGIKISGGDTAFQMTIALVGKAGNINFIALAIGVLSIIIMMAAKKKLPRLPTPLLLITISIILFTIFRFDKLGIAVVGDIPRGLPSLTIPYSHFKTSKILLVSVFTIVFVGFMESISVAKSIAAKNRYKIDADQELRALGLANITSSFFSGYPVTGGFSRTAVNYNEGARTGGSSIITAVIIILSLLFLTPLFYYLPNVVLASIIVTAVLGLIDIKTARRLFKIKPADGWVLLATFCITLFIGIEQGIIGGVIISLLLFIWRSSHPRLVELGYVAEEGVFRDIKRFPQAQTFQRTLIVRTDASLYFANTKFIEDWLHKRIVEKKELRWVIMDFSGVNDIDAVSVDTIKEIIENYHTQDINFAAAGLKGQIRDVFERAQLSREIAGQFYYGTLRQAVKALCPKGFIEQ
jgi:SulP family sulfate permease